MINRLMNDLKESMKNKEKSRKEVIQLIIGKAKGLAKDELVEVEDKHVLSAINSELKQTRDALEQMRVHLTEDKIKDYEFKISVIESYLPKQLTRLEVETQVENALIELGVEKASKNMGIIMKFMREKFGMSIDGKFLSEVVKNKLA